MSTTAIINNIRTLPLAEQHFVVEQVLKSIHNAERKQARFTEIPEGYMTGDEFEAAVISDIKNYCRKNGLL